MQYHATWKNSSRLWFDVQTTLEKTDRIVVFDLETTGLSRVNDRIIEIAAIRYTIDKAYNMHEEDVLHYFINPEMQLNPAITELTGITDEQLASAPTEAEIFDEIQDFFECMTVGGYNIDTFDVPFMENLYGRMGTFFTPNGSVDGIKLARDRLVKDRDVVDYKLISVADFFGIHFEAHSAIEDARTTGKVIQLLLKEYIKAKEDRVPLVTTGSIKPDIKRISFWEGYKGFSRIYVITSAGSLYYDIRSATWGGKDVDISTINMKYIEAEAWRLTESIDEKSFAAFKGEITSET